MYQSGVYARQFEYYLERFSPPPKTFLASLQLHTENCTRTRGTELGSRVSWAHGPLEARAVCGNGPTRGGSGGGKDEGGNHRLKRRSPSPRTDDRV